MTALPKDPEQRAHLIEQILSDTGAFCRVVLGMDTDRDQKGNATSGIGKGGVRPYGPHQEVITFLDDWNPKEPFKLLMAPRFSYKSSIIQGLIQRAILAFPDIAILLVMANKRMAAERVAKIKNSLESNPIIQELFPGLRCTGSKYAFTSSLRRNATLQTPTLEAGSPQGVPTGGRYNLIIGDDIADDNNTRTDEGLTKSIDKWQDCLFLRGADAIMVNVGTPRDDQDLNSWLNQQPGWKKCTHLDIGFDVFEDENGQFDLEGEQRWENLSREFLLSQLRGGTPFSEFMSQYKLRVVTSLRAAFKREQFQGFNWKDEEHSKLTGYLLTDVATSNDADACLNVLMEVGVDHRGHIFILDLEVGRWPMLEFVQRLLSMRARWSGRINHQAEMMETTHATGGYASMLGIQSRARGERLNLVKVQRNAASKSKDVRILGCQGLFQDRRVHVNNAMAGRMWMYDAEERLLWHPENYQDPNTKAKLPDGDLVEQFVRFRPNGKMLKDIPDTFAMVLEQDEHFQPLCFYRRPSQLAASSDTVRRTVEASGPKSGYTTRFYQRALRGRG